MGIRYYSNTASQASLAAAVGASDTTLTFTAGSFTGYPTQFPYTAAIARGTADEEVVLVTAASGDTVTVTRGYDSTVAKAHGAGATFVEVVVAQDYREANAHVNATAAHGTASAVVGVDDPQTLTQKTLTNPAVTDGTFTGTQTVDQVNVTTLTVTGVTTLANATVSGNATVGGTFTVTGTTTLTGALTAAGGIVGGASAAANFPQGLVVPAGKSTTVDALTAGAASVASLAASGPVTGSDVLKGAGLESTAGLVLAQIAAPAGTASKDTVYAKTDGGVYVKQGAGAESRLKTHWGAGTAFPTVGALAGDTFQHTGLGALFTYDGAAWWQQSVPAVADTTARAALAGMPARFRIKQTDTKSTYEWDGAKWVKAYGLPEYVWHVDNAGGSGTISVGASGAGMMNAIGPVPAHTAGTLRVVVEGTWTSSALSAGGLRLGWSTTNTFAGGTTLTDSYQRIHNNGKADVPMTFLVEGFISSDGGAKYLWLLGDCDAGSAAGYSIFQTTWKARLI